MVSGKWKIILKRPSYKVLILVLVEDGLGELKRQSSENWVAKVLILVLVEDGLGVRSAYLKELEALNVLILVLVEDGLGEEENTSYIKPPKSLNPCFSGGWSRSSETAKPTTSHCAVLILVLVEDGLGVYRNDCHIPRKVAVLILVLVEDGLGDPSGIIPSLSRIPCLNPCFSGGWSRRHKKKKNRHA